jgi:glucose-6-phosphate-specific signal transduction histidine kinase
LRRRDLTALADRLMVVQEEQLRQMSRELHEEIGQSLTAVSSYPLGAAAAGA